MNFVVLYMPLPFIGGGDVGFGIFDEIAPADTADVGVLAAPNGGADIAEAFVLCFAIEHIVPHNGEDHMVVVDCATLGTASTSL